MAHTIDVVVRALPGAQNLEGAYRLHLSPESLEAARLKLGDLCEVVADGATTVGYGIAWRATDKARSGNPATKPVAITDILRTALGVREGSHATVRKATAQLSHAATVFLRDVTPPQQVGGTEDDQGWKLRIGFQLLNCEAFGSGLTFDLVAKNKVKKRFEVVSVDGSDSNCSLFYLNDRTEIIIGAHKTIQEKLISNGTLPGKLLDEEHIGGLVNQLQNLNRRMKRLLDHSQGSNSTEAKKTKNGVLLHGFEGTGKSFLLKQLQLAPIRRVVTLDTSSLTGGSARAQDKVKSIFQEAKANQPSLILADDIQSIAPPSDRAMAKLLCLEMEGLQGHRVFVVATCRTPLDVHSDLLMQGCFRALIELPIPDKNARTSILEILLPRKDDQRDLAAHVANHTHGFTGKDLASLVGWAEDFADERQEDMAANASISSTQPSGTATTNQNVDDENETKVNGKSAPEPDKSAEDARGLTWEDFELAFKEVIPTALREIIFEKPKIGWKDIGGSGDIKERFDKALEWPIKHPGALELHCRPPTQGILLYGPPGCSKTLTAQAVASHYGLNFISVKGGELISMYVGESERKIRELFSKARQAAPCVIFFDEVDSIASERQSEGSKGLNVLTTLLTEMDGFAQKRGVLVLAATNKPDLLDPAIMRPGRFGSKIYLGPPNAAARRDIFAIQLGRVPTEQGIDKDRLVDGSEGLSGAEIVEICGEAVDQSIDRYVKSGEDPNWKKVSMEDLEEALAHTKKGITSEMLSSYQAFATI